jgi:hypothetical protein
MERQTLRWAAAILAAVLLWQAYQADKQERSLPDPPTSVETCLGYDVSAGCNP